MKISHWSTWEAEFDRRLEAKIKWFNTPNNMVEGDEFCVDCCNPEHWKSGERKPYVKPQVLGGTYFEKFDYENYKPKPKSALRIKIDKELAEEAKYGYAKKLNCWLWDMTHMNKANRDESIDRMFTLNWVKTKREVDEEQHTKEWKAGGCKSLKQLFNLD